MMLQTSTALTLTVAAGIVASAIPASAHDPVSWNGSEFQILLDAEETGGSIGMFTETTSGPGGPPAHVHDDADEAFVLLEGEARAMKGGEISSMAQGEAVFVPRGTEHTFSVVGESGGKLLIIVAPAGFEGFFSAVAAEDLKIPDDMERINELAARFKQRLTGPPMASE
jgi:mannose-6-phosphate isomerase-like protein (cupin superfamily)